MKNFSFSTLVLGAILLFSTGSAKAQIGKGYEVVPMAADVADMCNQVIDLQLEDPEKGNKIFSKVLKKVSKDKDQLISVGDFFLEKKVYQVAKMCADQCYKLDPKYIPGLMFAGLVNKSRGFATGNETFFGLAGQKYEEVLAIDPNNVDALRQNVTIYKKINPAAAVGYLQTIAAVNPDDYTVEQDLGDIDYGLRQYSTAREHYAKYFAACPVAEMDELAAQNYANCIASAHDFAELGDVCRKFSAQWPKDMVFKRMVFLSDVFTQEYDKAAESVKYITEEEYADSLYINLDYSPAMAYFKYLGDNENAIKYAKKLLTVDPENVGVWAEIASLYLVNGNYDEAIDAYKKFFAGSKDVVADDYYRFGRAYFSASRAEDITPEKQAQLIADGDAAFAKAIEMEPENYAAGFWRARLHMTSASTPQEEAKDAFLDLLSQLGDYNEDDVEAYRTTAYNYLAFFYAQNDDNETALRYVNEWLKFQPDNETAAYYKSVLEQ
ncbi:MAG: tetratricopeptide repeat protein [Alloprevotella sp.]|nr:tetratricopeptide repeat protein [Alloprevotella sp.]